MIRCLCSLVLMGLLLLCAMPPAALAANTMQLLNEDVPQSTAAELHGTTQIQHFTGSGHWQGDQNDPASLMAYTRESTWRGKNKTAGRPLGPPPLE